MNPEWLLHSSDSWSSQNSLFTNLSFITNYSSSTTWHCMIWIESLCAGIGWKLSLHISVLLINVILLFKAIFYLWITLNIGKLALSYVPWVCYMKICARVCHWDNHKNNILILKLKVLYFCGIKTIASFCL